MEARTLGCLYLEPNMNGTGTHSFMRLDNKAVIAANHYTVLPIPDIVTTLVNGWASKNKVHTSLDPAFTFHDVDITHDAADAVALYCTYRTYIPYSLSPYRILIPDTASSFTSFSKHIVISLTSVASYPS